MNESTKGFVMTKLKKLSWIICSCATFMAFAGAHAAQPGAYMGLQLGWGQVHNAGISESDANVMLADNVGTGNFFVNSFSSDTTVNGLAGRIYAGWQFNCFWGLEFGYAKFPNAPTHATVIATEISPAGPIVSQITSGSIATDAFDIDIKGILPLRNHFNLYGKIGYAYLEAWSQETLQSTSNGVTETADYNDNKHRYYPTFAVGASYDFCPDFGMDLSYTRIQKTGSDSALGSTDMVALGAYMNFGYI